MQHLTYSEQRQRVLLKASRELRSIACQLLDDCSQIAELEGETARWSITNAASTARRASDMEDEGYAQAYPVASGTLAAVSRSRSAFHSSLALFHERLAAVRGLSTADAEDLTADWVKASREAEVRA